MKLILIAIASLTLVGCEHNPYRPSDTTVLKEMFGAKEVYVDTKNTNQIIWIDANDVLHVTADVYLHNEEWKLYIDTTPVNLLR